MALISPTRGEPGVDQEGAAQVKEVNALTEVIALLNGNLDSSNIKDASIQQTDLAAALQALLVPAGSYHFSARSTPPTGYLTCDGSAVSRTDYAGLFAAIGTTYGAGDGSTTFNLPDVRGRVLVGKGQLGNIGTLGGSDSVAVGSRSPVHTHLVQGDTAAPYPNHTFAVTAGSLSFPTDNTHTHAINLTSGIGGPAYLVANCFIKT